MKRVINFLVAIALIVIGVIYFEYLLGFLSLTVGGFALGYMQSKD